MHEKQIEGYLINSAREAANTSVIRHGEASGSHKAATKLYKKVLMKLIKTER